MNRNCYTYVVGVDLFNGNNIYVARCLCNTGSKCGGQESGSTHTLQWYFTIFTYVRCKWRGKLSCAKTTVPIEIPFGFWAWMGPRNHVLDASPHPPWETEILMSDDTLA